MTETIEARIAAIKASNRATRFTREFTRVAFQPNPVSRLLYSGVLPPVGEVGEVTTVSFGHCRRSYLAGPAGGLLYVKWPSIGTKGISPIDLVRA